jgi:hypothetical protein
MNERVALVLRLLSAYAAGEDEACRDFLNATGEDPEQLLFTLTALAHELATFAAAGYRESPEEILQVIGRTMSGREAE